MKISMGTKLGQGLVNKGNATRAIKASNERFQMTKKEMINSGVCVKQVKDKMGMLMGTQALGDLIAETIRTGMNVCALDMRQFFEEEDGTVRNTLGDNALDVALMYSGLYWKCWDRETKSVNMEKAQEIVDKRKGAAMFPIYEEEDIALASNKYNMQRFVYGVNDHYLRKAELALAAINEDTTLEELEKFQRMFVFPTRGLGEQTIDVNKHVNYVFYTTMKGLISPHITVVGAIKKLESNIEDYRRTKEEYTIIPDQDKYAGKNFRRDVIGIFKQTAVDVMESNMRDFIDILEKETNFESYKQYEDIELTGNAYLLAACIDTAEDAVMNMDTEDRERTLAGIYNMARDLKIAQEDVFKIAMKLAISQETKDRKGNVHITSVLGTNREYSADLWKAAMLFGDVFVSEYAGSNIIEVSVDYETETDIEEGEIINITNGYGYGGMLHILSPFQNGQVKVKDGEVVALYDPLQTILDRYPDATVLPVDSYAKDVCRFSDWTAAKVEDLENETSVGFNEAKNATALRIVCPKDKDNEYCVVAISKDNSITAAAKVKNCYRNVEKDFVVKNAVCFKSLIVADQKINLSEDK